ncbi:MAG: RNA-binding protein [Candidatus Eisenbacteria bacterium]|nr:RNA-binding protein [Candidatus Eisenbacteria bacterium]
MARCDVALKHLCLFKTRSQATEACKEGRVLVDGSPAKPSQELRPGQRLLIRDRLGLREREVEILQVPERQVARKQLDGHVRVTARRRDPA